MEKYDINKLALLSKLSFDETELLSMADDMKNIIELMDNIKKTDAIYDTCFENYKSILRDDTPGESMTADELSNLSVESGFFSVSKVI